MKRQALLIGINKYQTLGRLSFARQDAEAFAETLCDQYGFSSHDINLMTCEVEGTGIAFSRYVELAISDLVKYRDLDLLVFGFWGHGFAPEAGKRYLCGLDTIVDDLERTAVSMDLIKAKLSQVGAENTLLVLDCCQNKPTGRSVEAQTLSRGEEAELSCLARDIQAARRKKAKLTVPTVAVLNSCREGQRAYEWEEREHGVFTAHLLDQMASGSSSIAQLASSIFDPVAHTSMNLHRKAQTPFVVIEGKGDIQLLGAEAANKKTSTTSPPKRQPQKPSEIEIEDFLLCGSLVVTCNVGGADIKIGSVVYKSKKGSGRVLKNFPVGSYSVSASKKGYNDFHAQVEVEEDAKAVLRIKLEKTASKKPREIKKDGNYILFANGIVLDTGTNLEWVAGPDKDTDWDEAKRWVESLDTAGGGWRMPTLKELKGLYQEDKGSRNMTPLFETTGWFMWSGETKGSSSAWRFGFLGGAETWGYRGHSNGYRAFAVRSRR